MSSTMPIQACDKSTLVNIPMTENQPDTNANTSGTVDQALSLFQATLLKEMHEAVIFLDVNCQVVFWNQSATNLTGRSSDKVLGQVLKPGNMSLSTRSGQPIEEIHCPFQHAIRSEKKTTETYCLVSRNGRRSVVELTVTPVMTRLGQQTTVHGAVVRFHDASELFQLREQLSPFSTESSVEPLAQVGERATPSRPLPAPSDGNTLTDFDPLNAIPFSDDGKRLLFAGDFISINPMHMVGEKLVGFIRDVGARLIECKHDFVSLLIKTTHPNDSDRESTFQVDIELHDAGRNLSSNPCTRIRLVIHPPKRRILGPNHEDLYPWIVRDLRRYLMITDNDTSRSRIFIGKMKTN